MAKIEYQLFGYRCIKGEEGKESRLATLLVNQGIASESKPDGSFLIRERDFKRFSRFAAGRIRYKASPPLGLPGAIKRNLVHTPTALAAVLGLCINLFLSSLVWDVRVSGNEKVEDEVIVDALEASGFGVGSIWSCYDKEATETELLRALEQISWISINRRGSVAYIEVKETAEAADNIEDEYQCSNIVATRDCVIEEINVRHGRAVVKVGDTVKQGDILISGIIESEAGTYFTRAEGNIKASIVKSVVAEAREVEEVTEHDTSRVYAKYVKVFGYKINIFKNYGNLPPDCDIIENEVVWTLENGIKMPASLITEYISQPIKVDRAYTESELPIIAAARLDTEIAEAVGDGDLIKLRTSGAYTEDGYRMVADIVLSAEVGREAKVDITK